MGATPLFSRLREVAWWARRTLGASAPPAKLAASQIAPRQHLQALANFKTHAPRHTSGPDVTSSIELDVVIPVAPKDEAILPAAVESLRRNLRHPIGSIILIAQPSESLQALAQRLGCELVDERGMLPLHASDIIYTVNGRDRSRWLFQQLLKLAADTLTHRLHYLVVDADVVLTRPQVFEWQGMPLLLHSDEHHEPYFGVCQKLLGFDRMTELSSVAHMMLFDVGRLRALKAHIEALHGCAWHEAVLRTTRFDNISGFSEYELYGQWCLCQYPAQTHCEYWFGLPLQRSKLASLPELEKQYGNQFRSIAFHAHLNR